MTQKIVLTSSTEPVERAVLFEIDGKEYTIPAKPRANMALKYLKMLREDGENVANGELLEAMLGTEGYDALMNYDDLTAEDLTHVIESAQKVMLGGLEKTL